MNEWRELPDGPELDLKVALKAGWHAAKLDTPVVYTYSYPDPPGRIECWWVIADNDGNTEMSPWDTESNAWEHFPTPAYSTDLNVAISLVGNVLGFDLENDIDASTVPEWRWTARIDGTIADYANPSEGHASTPALAVCYAYLAYTDTNEMNKADRAMSETKASSASGRAAK